MLAWFTSLRYRLKQYGKEAIQTGGLFYVLAVLVLLPVWFDPHMPLQSTVQDTLFVVDISESMNVRDVDFPRPHTDRLTLAKLAVRESMASLPCGSRVSLALFAGDESVVLFEPLEVCRHFPAIERVVMGVDRRMRWIGDSWVTKALTASIKEAYKRHLNVVMLTDGDEMPKHVSPIITDLIKLKGKVPGLLIGVGGEAIQPIPKLNQQDKIVGYWTKEEAVIQGNHPNLLPYVRALAPGEQAPAGLLDEVTEHLSSYNKTFMQALSQAINFPLVHIKAPKDAVSALNNPIYQVRAMAERDARWIFSMVSVILVLLGWFWSRLVTIKRLIRDVFKYLPSTTRD